MSINKSIIAVVFCLSSLVGNAAGGERQEPGRPMPRNIYNLRNNKNRQTSPEADKDHYELV